MLKRHRQIKARPFDQISQLAAIALTRHTRPHDQYINLPGPYYRVSKVFYYRYLYVTSLNGNSVDVLVLPGS